MNRNIPMPTSRPPTAPGEIILEEFLVPMGITQQAFATALGVSRARVNEILNGRRAVTPDTALRLQKVLGMDAQFWLGLQLMRDLYNAEQSEAIRSEVRNLRPLIRA